MLRAPYSSQIKPDLSLHFRTRYILMFSPMSSTLSPSLFLPARPFVRCLPHVSSRLLPQRYYSHVFTCSSLSRLSQVPTKTLLTSPTASVEVTPSRASPHLTRDVWSMLRRRSKSSSHYPLSADPAGSSKSVSRPSARTVRVTQRTPSRAMYTNLIRISHRVWRHHRERVPTRGPPRHALCSSLCAFILLPFTCK